MVRSAKKEDLPVILEITNEAILNTTAIYEYDIWTEEKVLQWYNDRVLNGFPIIVLEEKKQVIGFGTFGSFRPRIGYRFTVEHSVYVSRQFRGGGFGSILLKELINKAKERNYHAMIGVIDATNKGSIEFHKKHGFVISGTLNEVGFKFDRRLSITLMQLLLKP